ncbi:MAG: putative PEP-binding protein, partial [Oscillospiraceae bacterium]
QLYDPSHVAVMRMIKMVVENGKKNGVWTGICGECASDLELVPIFLAMGIVELSVTPTMVLDVRGKIRSINIGDYKEEVIKRLAGGTNYELYDK